MIRFVAPSGADFTRRQAGTDDSADSNADAQGWAQCVSVPASGSRRGVDAGSFTSARQRKRFRPRTG